MCRKCLRGRSIRTLEGLSSSQGRSRGRSGVHFSTSIGFAGRTCRRLLRGVNQVSGGKGKGAGGGLFRGLLRGTARDKCLAGRGRCRTT